MMFSMTDIVEFYETESSIEPKRIVSIFINKFLADQCPKMQMPTESSRFNKISLCVRMRSSLTKRAPNMKTPGYRVRSFFR